MRRPRSLRLRLTLQSIAVSVLLVGGAAVLITILVGRVLWAALDAELGEEVETLCTLLQAGVPHAASQAAEAVAREASPGPGKFVLLLHGNGAVTTAGIVPPSVRRAVRPGASETRTIATTPGVRYRVVLRSISERCTGAVGVLVDRQIGMLARARLATGATALALLASFSVLTWVTTGRAASQLGRLAREVEAIESTALSRRLQPSEVLEVDRLTDVLNRLLERLEAAMDRLRAFAANAAHELRTPIAALRVRLEVTIANADTVEEYRDGVLDVIEQTERLQRISEDLLSLGAMPVT